MGAPEATLKKKFVSCPAGIHTSGQSGGRKIFLFFNIFFLCIEMVGKMLGKKENIRECEKKCAHPVLKQINPELHIQIGK